MLSATISIPASVGVNLPGAALNVRERFAWWTRPRRILLVLGGIWLLNACDLVFTVLESVGSQFTEMNPIAAYLLDAPIGVLISYKTALVGLGSAILWLHRRERIAELATWLVFAAYATVLTRWAIYYGHMLDTLQDPAINVPPTVVWFMHLP